MITAELAHLLETCAQNNADIALEVFDHHASVSLEGFDVSIASIPDDRTVMLFAEAGFVPGRERGEVASDEQDWELLDAPEESFDRRPGERQEGAVLLDRASSQIALVDSAGVEVLDAPAFERWLREFMRELVELRAVLHEVATELGSLHPAAIFG